MTFNGSGFDLPVLRYRAMVHAIPATGLAARPYFHRYSDDAIDLCDVLSSYSSQAKVGLHELCKVMGLPGKPTGISGADVEKYYLEGRIREIADYCESDVLNTYEAMKVVCIIAAQELITMGVWDPDSMRRLRSSLNKAIANTS